MQELLRAAWTGLRLICPACGQGRIYRSLLAMNQKCPHCGVAFDREEGDFLGAMVVAYSITAVLVVAGALAVELVADLNPVLHVALWGVGATLFLILTYRNMKGLWLGILHVMAGLKRPGSGT